MNVLEARRRMLGAGVYKKTVTGNPAIAQGSLSRMYPGIEMQGWTEQAQYEGNQLFDQSLISSGTQGGATVTNNGDGSFTISGEGQVDTSGFAISAYISGDEARKLLRVGTIFSNNPTAVPRFYCYALDADKNVLLATFNSAGQANVTSETLQKMSKLFFEFYSAPGSTITPGTIWPMMWQDGDGTWEPYTGGQPSPNPDYPQEIVSAGNWNEETQKWEYEVKLTGKNLFDQSLLTSKTQDGDGTWEPYRTPQTVTLTADRPLTKWDRLEKRGGQWGWVYKSTEIVLDGSEDETWSTYNIGFRVKNILPEVMLQRECYCTQFTRRTSFDENSVWVGSNSGNSDIYFPNVPSYYDAELQDKGLGNFKQHVSEKPITILTYLDEETFVPISASEQEQMNELYTFRPTTVLSNDAGCEMSLTYKTKKSLEVTT